MSSTSEGIAAVERIAEELEDAGVEVRAVRDCGLATSTDGDHVHATIEVFAPVDALTETDDGTGTRQDTTTDDVDAGEDSLGEARGGDASPETRCGDTDDEPAAESASDAYLGSEGDTATDQDTTTDDTDVGGDTNHDIERGQLTPAQTEVVDALNEHGELTSSEVETITGRSYKHLSNLEARGVVESRKDPDDGRRHLYSLSPARLRGEAESDGGEKDYDEGDDAGDQEDVDEGQVADAGAEIGTAATNGALTVADIDWLDESSFHVAVAESTGLQQLRDTLGWRDEDGDLAALVRGMDATGDLPDFQEGNA